MQKHITTGGVFMLNERLRSLRLSMGLTQMQVAEALNIDRSTYTYYETGKTVPDVKTIIKLSKIFNVSYQQILDDESVDFNINSSVKDRTLNLSEMSELTKQERLMIVAYRLLTADMKKKYLNKILADAKTLIEDNTE